MPLIDTTINPVSIAAFVLTCLGCVHSLAAVFMTNWWSSSNANSESFYGVWKSENCVDDNNCIPLPSTELRGGEEALFVSKIFATFTMAQSLAAFVLHIIYAIIRLSIVRTISIFMLGSAGLFGLLSVFVFMGFYNATKTDLNSIGAAFYLFLFAAFLCLAAAVFTAWASVRKVSGFQPTSASLEKVDP